VTDPKPSSAKKFKPARAEDAMIQVEAGTRTKLQQLAKSRGISIDELIRQFIEDEPHRPPPKKANRAALPPKQAMVLEYLKSGLSVKETANKMGVTEDTVRTHILRARSRLDCSDLLSLRFQ
jgi:DNA-binding NarL/FixJ family response regulator